MQNIVKLQETLKNLSDQQLAQEMQSPSGSVPQFLIMTEMNRRNEMRQEAKKAPEGTVADELVQTAQQPMGIMNLPDETLAGAAMRARISGQQQQAPDGMVAMPPQGAAPQGMPPEMPQGMADGGAVQFGNIFGNMGGNAGMQASQTPELMKQNYMPTNGYVPPAKDNMADKYSHLFDTVKGAPNPRVHMSDAERYGLPKGMAAPTYGTPGLNRTFTGREGQNTKYSWANDAARDAYIRYMTPPAAPAKTMADGGVAHFEGQGPSHVTLDEEDPVVIPGMPFSESWPYFMSGSPMGAFPYAGLPPITGAGVNALRQTGALGPVRKSEIDDLVPASEGSIRKPKNAPPASAVSGSPPPPAAEDPMSGGILSGKNPFEGMSGKYEDMLRPAPERQPIPQIGTYALEPTPALAAPAQPIRDYAGETKSEINKLLESLGGDTEALKQRDRDMALAQAGFAIAASKNPYALGAVGEGAQVGLADYAKSRKEAKALDAERIKAQIAAAGTAGEMGQRQGLAEAEMGHRERISDRELGSRESIAKAQLAQSAATANIEAILKGDANAITRAHYERIDSLPPDEVRKLEALGGGDIVKGLAIDNATGLIKNNNYIINSTWATDAQKEAAARNTIELQTMMGMSGGGKTVVRTGTNAQGQRVEQYSDGTTAVVGG